MQTAPWFFQTNFYKEEFYGIFERAFQWRGADLYHKDDKSENKIQEHNMELRADAHEAGMQTMLNLVSWKTGSGGKRYTFRDGQVKTATEVISENSDLYRNLKKHELSLEAAICGLVDAIAEILHLGTVKSSVSFDNSIISDTDSDKMTFLQEIRDGVRQKWEYRVKFFGEDAETAKEKYIPAPVTIQNTRRSGSPLDMAPALDCAVGIAGIPLAHISRGALPYGRKSSLQS